MKLNLVLLALLGTQTGMIGQGVETLFGEEFGCIINTLA